MSDPDLVQHPIAPLINTQLKSRLRNKEEHNEREGNRFSGGRLLSNTFLAFLALTITIAYVIIRLLKQPIDARLFQKSIQFRYCILCIQGSVPVSLTLSPEM